MIPFSKVIRTKPYWLQQMLFLTFLILFNAYNKNCLKIAYYHPLLEISGLKQMKWKKGGNRNDLPAEPLFNGSSLLSVLCFLLVLIQMLLMLSGDIEPNPGPTIVTVDDVALIVKDIHSLRYKYESIGRALHVPEGVLSDIFSWNEPVVKCLQAVIHAWATSAESVPTWETLCDALCTLGKKELSDKIRHERCGKSTTDAKGCHKTPKPSNITESRALNQNADMLLQKEEKGNTFSTSPPCQEHIAQPFTLIGDILFRAAARGSLVLVRAILSHDLCDLMARDEEGNTALHVAASSGHHEMVEELASRMRATTIIMSHSETVQSSTQDGQNAPKSISPVEYPNNVGNTPLLVASKQGKAQIVSILLLKYNASSIVLNNHRNSCMHLAALHGHIPAIDLLVHEFSCSPHIKGYNSRTPLHYASGGGHVELVDKMISEYKCDKMARDIEGRTPLHMAALHGKKSVVKLLISKHECPVECTDNEGNTALLCASSRGHVSVVIMLHAEFGASVMVHNNINNTAVHLATLNGQIQILDIIISKLFCSPHTKGYKNRTPLHYACSGGHLKVVDMLITQYYCNPMARDSSGLIPLHMAALNGRAEVVRLLVTKYGCPVDYTAHNGCTALLFAASRGHQNVVEVLLSELGTSMEACDNNKNTVISLAALHGHTHLLSFLLTKLVLFHSLEISDPPSIRPAAVATFMW